ncbi:MAG: hypothetical protein RSG51_01470 [Bacilli bacterium]
MSELKCDSLPFLIITFIITTFIIITVHGVDTRLVNKLKGQKNDKF